MLTASVHPSRSRILHALIRLIAGGRRWGWLDVWPSRYGFTHYRLVVCSPGTTTTQRALLRLWRAWPTVVVLTGGLLLLASVAVGLPPVDTATIAGCGVAGVLLALAHLTRRERPLVRVRFGGTEQMGGMLRAVGDMGLIERSWNRLSAADRAMRSGRITALQHEIVWSRVWSELAPERRAARRRARSHPAPELRAPRRQR